MKKTSRMLLLMSVMVCPFIFAACEKDEGTTDYNDVSDDDWKKKNVVTIDDYTEPDVTTLYYVNE